MFPKSKGRAPLVTGAGASAKANQTEEKFHPRSPVLTTSKRHSRHMGGTAPWSAISRDCHSAFHLAALIGHPPPPPRMVGSSSPLRTILAC